MKKQKKLQCDEDYEIFMASPFKKRDTFKSIMVIKLNKYKIVVKNNIK